MDAREAAAWRQKIEAALAAHIEKIKALEATLAKHEKRLDAMADARVKATPGRQVPGGAVADDADLDGPYGDPEVKRDPPKWTGDSFAGQRCSACPSDYLRSLAGFWDWKAGKTEEEGDPDRQKYVKWDRLNAARARGWAARNEGKRKGDPPAAEPDGEDYGDPNMEIPF